MLLTDEQKDISCILIHAIKDEGITVYRKIIQVKRTFFFLIVKILYTHFFLQWFYSCDQKTSEVKKEIVDNWVIGY